MNDSHNVKAHNRLAKRTKNVNKMMGKKEIIRTGRQETQAIARTISNRSIEFLIHKYISMNWRCDNKVRDEDDNDNNENGNILLGCAYNMCV